jgi:hypothetical protein
MVSFAPRSSTTLRSLNASGPLRAPLWFPGKCLIVLERLDAMSQYTNLLWEQTRDTTRQWRVLRLCDEPKLNPKVPFGTMPLAQCEEKFCVPSMTTCKIHIKAIWTFLLLFSLYFYPKRRFALFRTAISLAAGPFKRPPGKHLKDMAFWKEYWSWSDADVRFPEQFAHKTYSCA